MGEGQRKGTKETMWKGGEKGGGGAGVYLFTLFELYMFTLFSHEKKRCDPSILFTLLFLLSKWLIFHYSSINRTRHTTISYL